MRGVNAEDEAAVPQHDKPCPLPNLFVAAKQDFVCRADLQITSARKWVPDLRIETVDCGHWVQLEEPELLNKLIIGFGDELVGKVKGEDTMQARNENVAE